MSSFLLVHSVCSARGRDVRLPQQEWKDPSPHTTRLVTVEEGVQLEVLDWGGPGPARASSCWPAAERRRTTTMTLPLRWSLAAIA